MHIRIKCNFCQTIQVIYLDEKDIIEVNSKICVACQRAVKFKVKIPEVKNPGLFGDDALDFLKSIFGENKSK